MEKTFETKHGAVTLRKAMLEAEDNTTLNEGIEIVIAGKLEAEVLEAHIDLDEISVEGVEEFVETFVEYL